MVCLDRGKRLSSIYFFEEGNATERMRLGGKGANLCEMTRLGLPVPPGFILTTDVCNAFLSSGKLEDGIIHEVGKAMTRLEEKTGKEFGSATNPLLVSVRSGAAVSMPGMMDTILNLGLNENTVKGLASSTRDEGFALDAYRRFVQLFGRIVLGVEEDRFTEVLEARNTLTRRTGSQDDGDPDDLRYLVEDFKELCESTTGSPFPEDPLIQLRMAIAAVFRSWNGKRCVDYRKQFGITPDIADGTAVNVVAMVFGNLGKESGTGVLFTRNPSTGEKALYGEFLMNAQGEDIVAGIRTPKPIENLQNEMPESYGLLKDLAARLERHYKEPQDIEFTIERGKLFLLQTRNAKMNAFAQMRSSVDMTAEGLIDESSALLRIMPQQLEQLLHRTIDPRAGVKPITRGIGAAPGVSSGRAVFDADRAEKEGKAGQKVILVREETKPEDIHGFFAAEGILTSRGGKTSHAAVVARGMGKPCVCGAGDLQIDQKARKLSIAGMTIGEGEIISIDGTTGDVFFGEIPTLDPEIGDELVTILSWADNYRRMGIRANTDTPEDASVALEMGAEGIGLCRTERMFNAQDRLPMMVEMIVARNHESRARALERLLPLQRKDFIEIFRVMKGLPVTIRLLDPPMHEFLPNLERLQDEIHALRVNEQSTEEIDEKMILLHDVERLSEVNPMLGHRGVRIGITTPEVYEMQLRAICEAIAELVREGLEVKPQVMVPQVASEKELEVVARMLDKIRLQVEKEKSTKIPLKLGSMMEVVRSCLIAGKIAKVAEFFSFGTNDLTQGTFSFSREDAENKFLPEYLRIGVINRNPFQTLDPEGVGKLMRFSIRDGRKTRKDLEIGICGEHGGDPESIELCEELGLDYVSCSAFRIPIAKLAAAQASIRKSRSNLDINKRQGVR
ncbi:MAG: pyruvate, phosphate dikinase [Thaumarchaeota archaeon]|nr:pyruvate, phosphate dikinase [Nitrososphaerota archaeon]